MTGAEGSHRLRRCGCGAIVELAVSGSGGTVELEVGYWPEEDIPSSVRAVVSGRVVVSLDSPPPADANVRMLHEGACPRRVRTRPSEFLVGDVWEHHRLNARRASAADDPRLASWAQQRRNGVSAREIAAAAGVEPTWVRDVTEPLGPFPRPGTPSERVVQGWIGDRQRGMSATAIARREGIPAERVRNATREAGPFKRRRHEPGMLGITDIARLLNVGKPTIYGWRRRGLLPPPAETGRQLESWDADVVAQWADEALTTCECGARLLDVKPHRANKHT